MPDTLSGFPFSTLEFDKGGSLVDAGALDALIATAKAKTLTDLFIFSHGWNNDHAAAMSLYERFFAELSKVLNDGATVKKNPAAAIGVAGVLWPSILWPDDAASAESNAVVVPSGDGGAASVSGAAPNAVARATPAEINTELKKGYDEAHQRTLLDALTALLETQPKSDAAIAEFKAKLGELLATERPAGTVDRKRPDDAEGAMATLSDTKWRDLLEELADRSGAASTHGGAAGLGNPFKKLWEGAKDALRVGTYWQMKQRAGVVGRDGLGPALARIAKDAPGVRVHLLGHSFGARLVSFSLSGLPDGCTGATSPVKSLFLLQGAFSHSAFADKLPHDQSRSGALKGMSARVDGPLLTTHSLKDLAVGVSYPAASALNGDSSSAFEEKTDKWGAMGHDGAMGVHAEGAPLGEPGTTYTFASGQWLNLDGNKVIIHGGLPSGAHSDIAHPHTAWAALAAAGIV